jgi:hypothetical protein
MAVVLIGPNLKIKLFWAFGAFNDDVIKKQASRVSNPCGVSVIFLHDWKAENSFPFFCPLFHHHGLGNQAAIVFGQ